jgi:NAD(P)-dependent dehydrogenase (short-subunit alcohol dehydrogenase family)
MHQRVNSELQRLVGLTAEQRAHSARSSALLLRLVTTEEVAGAALFLASSDSAAITGQTLNVDSGTRFD